MPALHDSRAHVDRSDDARTEAAPGHDDSWQAGDAPIERDFDLAMLTRSPRRRPPHARTAPTGDVVCWFEGAWVPLADAKVGIMTHSFLYGTAVFEGIRAYWNAEQGQLYLLKLREHYERIIDSGKIMMMDPGYTVQELIDLTVELVRRNGYKEDAYVRPTLYKSSEAIGVRLHNVDCKINILAIPFGDYIDTNAGIKCGTVSWRRTSDLAIPSRAKIVGLVRQPRLLQDGGDAQRLRRGHRADPRRQGRPRAAPRTCSWSAAARS